MKRPVTGSAGFAGSAVARLAVARGIAAVNLDALTYAACLDNVASVAGSNLHSFEQADIRDRAALDAIFARHRPDAVMHLAADSHVDRSIDGPADFVQTNITGTCNLLKAARERYGVIAFYAQGRVGQIIEKPAKPPSNCAIIGLYFLNETAPDRAATIKPSPRGEIEIVDLLEGYLADGSLIVAKTRRGFAWLNTGIHASLLDAGKFVRPLKKRQGLRTGSPDEIAFRNGWITADDIRRLALRLTKNSYGRYLLSLMDEAS